MTSLRLATLLAVLPTSLALAHHGFDGRYDLSTPIWIEGEVTSAYFGSPHSEIVITTDPVTEAPTDLDPATTYLALDTLAPTDLTGEITLELPPTAQYSRLGPRLRPGDRIAAIALCNCEPPHQLNVQWLRLADGSVEARAAAMSYMVEQC